MEVGRWWLGSWIGCTHLLNLFGDTHGTSTVYARIGETATLSWELPTPGLETFTVRLIVHWDRNMEMFRVTNYNSVTMTNNLPGWKMEFVGNITPWGTGEFSFILHDVTFQNGGHYRCYKPSFNTSAAEVPGCGQKLVVVDFQQPYIVAPETTHLDRSVTLSCCSIAYAYTGHGVNVSINWRRNGLLVDIGSIYITDVTAHGYVRYHTSRSTLTLSDISTSKGDNFQCQALAGAEMISRWSEVFTLVQQSGSTENYTVVREGHAALFSLKIPVRENFIIEAPRNGWLFEVDSLWVYIFYIYRTRVNIQRVTTSADAAVIEFWLHNAVSDDAGTYNCFRWYLDPFPNCPHVLYVHDFQQPYIVAPETTHLDTSVTLSCFSVFELHSGGDVRLTVSTKWRRNGLLVSDRIKNNVTEENHTWNGHRRYYRSTLTFDDTAKGDNFQCQAVVGLAVVSGWSEEYQQVKQLGSYQDYTLVREGHSAFVIWKMPLVDEDFFVEAPRYVRVFEVKFPRIYINDPYRARVNLTKVTTSADSVIVQFWLHNTTLDDAGKYHCFTLRHDPIPNCHHMLHVQATPETSLPLVAGSSVSVVIVTLAIIAGVIRSRHNQLRDYWNLRFRLYITPTQNMPENVDDREYAEIDDACIPERGEGNIVKSVVNVPPACADRQQLEGEDDEYEEVRPLDATNREERPAEQERRATMQQPDKEIQDAIKDERTLSDSQPHSELRIVAADWSADGREFGDFAAVSIDQFEETSFMTQEPNETVTDKLPAARGKYSGAGGITPTEAEANHPLVDGREDFAETIDLPCDRYESLMSPQPQPTYTALDNADDIAHD